MIEDLDDNRSLVGIWDESRLAVACAGAARIRMRLMFEPAAVRGSAAVAVALPRILDLAAPGLAAQFLDLELVEGLKDMADEAAFGAGLVTGSDGVEDLDPCPRELTLVGERVEVGRARAVRWSR